MKKIEERNRRLNSMFVMFLIVTCLFVCFTACGSDNEEPEIKTHELLGKWELKGVERNGQYNESVGQWMELSAETGALHKGDSITEPFTYAVEEQEISISSFKMFLKSAFRINADTLWMTTLVFQRKDLIFVWEPEEISMLNTTLVFMRMR